MLNYKTDDATLEGIYASSARPKGCLVSYYGSPKMEGEGAAVDMVLNNIGPKFDRGLVARREAGAGAGGGAPASTASSLATGRGGITIYPAPVIVGKKKPASRKRKAAAEEEEDDE